VNGFPKAILFLSLILNLSSGNYAHAVAPSGQLGNDLVGGNPLSASDRKIVILIHGNTNQPVGYVWCMTCTAFADQWVSLETAITTSAKITGTDTKVFEFHWEDDATNGKINPIHNLFNQSNIYCFTYIHAHS
jgi:hypothetical protein